MQSAVYILNTLTFGLCGALLLRAYLKVQQRLLLWSTLCFFGLALTNFLVFVDLVLTPATIDLYSWRLLAGGISTSLLLYGLIWESGRKS